MWLNSDRRTYDWQPLGERVHLDFALATELMTDNVGLFLGECDQTRFIHKVASCIRNARGVPAVIFCSSYELCSDLGREFRSQAILFDCVDRHSERQMPFCAERPLVTIPERAAEIDIAKASDAGLSPSISIVIDPLGTLHHKRKDLDSRRRAEYLGYFRARLAAADFQNLPLVWSAMRPIDVSTKSLASILGLDALWFGSGRDCYTDTPVVPHVIEQLTLTEFADPPTAAESFPNAPS